MSTQKAIINDKGYVLDTVFVDENDIILYTNRLLEKNEKIVDIKYKNLIKPRLKNDIWIEGATEEEIQAWKEENKPIEKEPNEQEILNAQLLEEIAQQKIVNVQLMQEIASLKGENANV